MLNVLEFAPYQLPSSRVFVRASYSEIVLHFLFMVALCNRADHYIFMLWFVLFSFFPRLISAVGDSMSTIVQHMVWS